MNCNKQFFFNFLQSPTNIPVFFYNSCVQSENVVRSLILHNFSCPSYLLRFDLYFNAPLYLIFNSYDFSKNAFRSLLFLLHYFRCPSSLSIVESHFNTPRSATRDVLRASPFCDRVLPFAKNKLQKSFEILAHEGRLLLRWNCRIGKF